MIWGNGRFHGQPREILPIFHDWNSQLGGSSESISRPCQRTSFPWKVALRRATSIGKSVTACSIYIGQRFHQEHNARDRSVDRLVVSILLMKTHVILRECFRTLLAGTYCFVSCSWNGHLFCSLRDNGVRGD